MTRRSLLLALLLLAALAGALPGASAAGSCEESPCNGTSVLLRIPCEESPCTGTGAFYGDPHGAGNQAGVCGYGPAIAEPPYSSMVFAAARNEKTSFGCGSCFHMTCKHDACNGEGVVVTFTDVCTSGPCVDNNVIQLSGQAFSAMALPGRDSELRASPTVPITYQYVDCSYDQRFPLAYRVDPRATPERFRVILLNVKGKAYPDLVYVYFKDASSDEWALAWYKEYAWEDRSGKKMQAPISIRTESHPDSAWRVTDEDVIPVGWHPGVTYHAA